MKLSLPPKRSISFHGFLPIFSVCLIVIVPQIFHNEAVGMPCRQISSACDRFWAVKDFDALADDP